MIKFLQILVVNLPLVLESTAQISQGNTVNDKEIAITARSGNLTATQTDFTSRDSGGKRICVAILNAVKFSSDYQSD